MTPSRKQRLTQLILSVVGYVGVLLLILSGVLAWNLLAWVGGFLFASGLLGVLCVGVLNWWRRN